MPRTSTTPSRLPLWCLIAGALALANGAWSAFLWQQLFVARSGGDPFCALGGGGCAALWDGGFASSIHALSGLPVAAWGIVWSGAAVVACLLSWNQARSVRDPEPFWSSAALLGIAGIGVVVILLGASLAAGEFCSNCAITYLLVAGYAGIVFVGSAIRRPMAWGRGAATAAATGAALFLVLLTPGLDTPRAGAQLGGEALARGAGGELAKDVELRRFVGSLGPRELQSLALARAQYLQAPLIPARGQRAVVGTPSAAMRLTTFTDSGCSHCANFHEALEAMLAQLPDDAIAVEQRMFPLDGSCNPHVRGRGHEELCLAARVRLCLGSNPQALDLSGWLHEDAAPLSEESIYRVATRISERNELEACVKDEATQRRIDEDVQMAVQAGLQGTPYLLVNGKAAATYLPFLYAMALADADPANPAFDGLPEIDPAVLADPHAGHDH